MISRDELTRFLTGLYETENYDDGCENGLQVEGKEKIEKIIFGVSFNRPFLDRAIKEQPDALVVHHGIFQQGVFKLTGILKQKVKMLLDKGISLYGIHAPMDAHPEMGHGALLLASIGAQGIEPFLDWGARGENAPGHSLDHILEAFHKQIHPDEFIPVTGGDSPIFSLSVKHGFTILRNGPQVPQNMAVITGGSSGFYEKAVEKGVDTFFGGDIKERTLAFSVETRTNFINLGHYFSEKPGVLALKEKIKNTFDVQTGYIEIANPV
jgi:dinuclear metal center YbgI/SA1388 family protein